MSDKKKKYKNENWLTEKWKFQNKSLDEIAKEADCHRDTVHRWIKKFGIVRGYKDEELLKELYHNKLLSQRDIAKKLNCSQGTVGKNMARLGIESKKSCNCNTRPAKITTGTNGYEKFQVSQTSFYHHRLLAVAEYGFDSVCGNVVHHISNIPWDNRPENLEVMTRKEHSKFHQSKQ